jgi:hypothetical protein
LNSGHTSRVLSFPDLKRVVPITAVLERYGLLGDLKRIGAQLFGACPIHKGSHQKQFVVDPAKSLWRCFGDCNRGGSTLSLVAELEHVGISEAARLVSDWFAIAPKSHKQKHRKQQRSTAMSGGRPTMKAFVVEDKEEGSEEKPFWTRVGSAWPHGDGKGLNIQIASGVAISGRLVLREYTEQDAQEDEKKNATKRKK